MKIAAVVCHPGHPGPQDLPKKRGLLTEKTQTTIPTHSVSLMPRKPQMTSYKMRS